jgi:hypothetical protein
LNFQIERRKIDAQEEALQIEKRKYVIEKANKHMHEGQDQVKAFHTKMLMCDVDQERQAQAKLVKRKQDLEKLIENQWLE